MEARGAFEKDPQRRRVDPVAVGDLGDAPAYFSEAEQAVWAEIKATLPPGLAKSADRLLVEIASRLMAKFRAGESLKSFELSQLVGTLGSLGMSPADRARCAMAPPPEDKTANEFAEFSS